VGVFVVVMLGGCLGPSGDRPPWEPGFDDVTGTGAGDDASDDDMGMSSGGSASSGPSAPPGDDGSSGEPTPMGSTDDGAGDETTTGGAQLEPPPCPDPQMVHFPVGAEHNIGYDNGSCGTGTCEISCPDIHANSDWNGAAGHHGIDIFAFYQAELAAVADAEVVAVGVVSDTSGLRVRLRDACGWEYYYGHLDEAFVSVGQTLVAGEPIGSMGATGTQSVHLHFNVSFDGSYSDDIDPFDLLAATSPTACD
jgi:murein DD-endopeptidase MepM/ murein hydrolase activator NlpD